MNKRTILHCDLNNFYASVECLLNPAIKDKFVAVCGNKEHRHGIVLAKNQLAKEKGVQTGETISEAQKKCPNLLVVAPHYEEYVNYAKKVQKIYEQYTDKIESFGLDECWLDVTNSINLFGDGKKIADKLREQIKNEIGLTISVGVSFCKVFSKLGSDLKKPDATTVISRENFQKIIWPLSVSDMIMIGKKTAEKLKKYKIYTLGDLANADDNLLKLILGINGLQIKKWANGNDDASVNEINITPHMKSIGHSTTTISDIKNYSTAKQVIISLSDMIAIRLRQNGLTCAGISLNIKYNNLSEISRQLKLPHRTFDGTFIANISFELLKQIWNEAEDIPLRLIGINVFNLSAVAQNIQESLFSIDRDEPNNNLNFTIDKIRKKYGYSIIKKARVMNNNLIAEKDIIKENEFMPFKKLN